MNISKINDFIKSIGLFLLANLTGILFLGGLALIVYAIFILSITLGFMGAGISLILVSLILNSEKP